MVAPTFCDENVSAIPSRRFSPIDGPSASRTDGGGLHLPHDHVEAALELSRVQGTRRRSPAEAEPKTASSNQSSNAAFVCSAAVCASRRRSGSLAVDKSNASTAATATAADGASPPGPASPSASAATAGVASSTASVDDCSASRSRIFASMVARRASRCSNLHRVREPELLDRLAPIRASSAWNLAPSAVDLVVQIPDRIRGQNLLELLASPR